MDYFECAAPAGNGRCSDNACPCPESEIPRGGGYLFISQDLVDFRRQYPAEEQAGAAMEARLRGAGFSGGFYSISPVLVCEQGAKLRNLDLKVAAADAAHWWATGKVPLRATPSANSQAQTAQTRSENEQASEPATAAPDQPPFGLDAQECRQPDADIRDAIKEGQRLAEGQQWEKAISIIEEAFVSTDADLDAELDASLRNHLALCFRLRAESLLHAAVSDANKPLQIVEDIEAKARHDSPHLHFRSLKDGDFPIPDQVLLPGGRRGVCCVSCGAILEGQYTIGQKTLVLCSTCSQKLKTEQAEKMSTLRTAMNTANECLVQAKALDPANREAMAALAALAVAASQAQIQLEPVQSRSVEYSEEAGTLWSSDNRCWFCGEAISQDSPNDRVSIKMQKVLRTREMGHRVLSRRAFGNVVAHRCRRCKTVHEHRWTAAKGGALIGCIAGIAASLLVPTYRLGGALLLASAGLGLGLLADVLRQPRGVKRVPDLKRSPAVTDLVTQGWRLPENAN